MNHINTNELIQIIKQMNINIIRGAYEAPKTEIVQMNAVWSVLTGSPVTPDAGITGSGFHFDTDTGSW